MKWKNIRIMGEDGGSLYEGPFNEIPVKEQYIIDKSIELYKEPEPCIIYRTHILKKLYLDMLESIGQKPKKGLVVSCEVWNEQKNTLELSLDRARVEFLS
ncbi:MAG: hypothetical protein MRZ36_08275 [Eubacterium sp.]|nr:hypothetical protein [Eubacterium sp.]